MLAEENVTCTASRRYATISEGLKGFSLIYSVFALSLVCGTLVLWRVRRKSTVLEKRQICVLYLAAIAVIIQVSTNALVRVAGPYSPCLLHTTLDHMFTLYALLPLIVRLRLWINTVTLNWYIAQTITKTTKQEGVEHAQKLAKLRYRSSSSYAVLVLVSICVPVTLSVFVLFFAIGYCDQDECEVSDLTPTLVVYQLLAGLLVAAIAVYFYKYRKVPDLVGIWAESLYACIFVFIMGAIYALLDTIDPGNIKSTVPVVFDWRIIVDFNTLGFFVMVFCVPLKNSFKVNRVPESSDDFRMILSSEAGAKFFKLFAATELSLENFLFYQRATAWRASYDGTRVSQLVQEAELIIASFIRSSGDFEINLPASVKAELLQEFDDLDGDRPGKDLFEAAVTEVFILMLTNSYHRFRKSKFYELYIGQVDMSTLDWVLETGIASEFDLGPVLATDL